MLINLVCKSGSFVPSEELGPLEGAKRQGGARLKCRNYTSGETVDVFWVDKDAGFADDLGHTGDVRGDDRGAASHGLEKGKTKAFVETGENEGFTGSVKGGEVGFGNETGHENVVLGSQVDSPTGPATDEQFEMGKF